MTIPNVKGTISVPLPYDLYRVGSNSIDVSAINNAINLVKTIEVSKKIDVLNTDIIDNEAKLGLYFKCIRIDKQNVKYIIVNNTEKDLKINIGVKDQLGNLFKLDGSPDIVLANSALCETVYVGKHKNPTLIRLIAFNLNGCYFGKFDQNISKQINSKYNFKSIDMFNNNIDINVNVLSSLVYDNNATIGGTATPDTYDEKLKKAQLIEMSKNNPEFLNENKTFIVRVRFRNKYGFKSTDYTLPNESVLKINGLENGLYTSELYFLENSKFTLVDIQSFTILVEFENKIFNNIKVAHLSDHDIKNKIVYWDQTSGADNYIVEYFYRGKSIKSDRAKNNYYLFDSRLAESLDISAFKGGSYLTKCTIYLSSSKNTVNNAGKNANS